VMLDPATSQIKKRLDLPYPNSAGVLATAGGVIFTATLDGTILALDDQTLETLWTMNVGTGIDAPPMTYAVNGKQYLAIATGLTRNQVGKLVNSPEMKDFSKNATLLFVFAL
jgi:alcohol dehydrogenase (cytochrome c)